MVALGSMPANEWEWEGAREYAGYSSYPDGVMLKEACDRYLRLIDKEARQPGDAILVKYERWPQHLGILTEPRNGHPYMIHATNDPRYMRVVESRVVFGPKLQLIAAYSFPGVG